MDLGTLRSEFPPHARGWTDDARHPTRQFPPHARGWTLPPLDDQRDPAVSPSRAGMDPWPRAAVDCRHGFPRTRGDGPGAIKLKGISSSFPPHARGWTRTPRPGMGQAGVSPARAGMDPPSGRSPRTDSGFPRTRGDGPASYYPGDTVTVFPPHARGWTRIARKPATHTGVSPARAGMDPATPLLRIPDDREHRFQSNVNTDSGHVGTETTDEKDPRGSTTQARAGLDPPSSSTGARIRATPPSASR